MALAVTRVLGCWQLTKADQLRMLGLDPRDHRALNRLIAGSPLPEKRDLIDRVDLIMSMYGSLEAICPNDVRAQARWIKGPNASFRDYAPFDVIERGGMSGLIRIARYLAA